ncbi:MAG: DUF1508 domain-containing protein [Candidatus Curtissbacteria bacterium]|nr:DUF1508 domain-containing protein [Candidatus Curtissbacteria bacterium]
MAVFKIYKDVQGYYRWRFRAANNKIIADSGEGYVKWQDAKAGIDFIKKYAPDAEVKDLTAQKTARGLFS